MIDLPYHHTRPILLTKIKDGFVYTSLLVEKSAVDPSRSFLFGNYLVFWKLIIFYIYIEYIFLIDYKIKSFLWFGLIVSSMFC